MQQRNDNGRGGWKSFRPSKVLWFWSSVGVFLATVIVGFSWGSWVTGGTAREMAEDARADGRASLVAEVCVQRFSDAPEFAERLSKLKEASTWDREDMIEKGNWTTLPGIEEPIENATDLCAERLAELEPAADQTAQDGTNESQPAS